MRTNKRIFSLVLALVFTVMMNTAAFAATSPQQGSITVQNATGDNTYAGYRIFNAYFDEQSEAVSYTVWNNSPWYPIVAGEPDVFVLTERPGHESDTPKEYSVKLKEGVKDEDVLSVLFNYEDGKCTLTLPDGAVADLAEQTPVSGGVVTWDNVDCGYYVVTSTLGSVVTVDTNTPDVTIIDKNQGPVWGDSTNGKVIIEGIEKVVSNSVAFGDTVTFDVSVNATNYSGPKPITYYLLSDTICDGFTLVDANNDGFVDVNVTVSGSDITNYNIKQNDRTFEIIIPWATADVDGASENAIITDIEPLYKSGSEIHVTYSAVLNKDAVIGGEGNPNVANYRFITDEIGTEPDLPSASDVPAAPEGQNSPYDPQTKKTTYTYTYALAIQKVKENRHPLSGAEFSIDGLAAIGADGVYDRCPAGTVGAVTEFDTDENGLLLIKGVCDGDYVVTETAAPKRYNKLEEPETIAAAFSPNYMTKTIGVFYYDAEGNLAEEETEGGETIIYEAPVPVYSKVIVNKSGLELPSTGGIGTPIFYAGGGLLIILAIVLLVKKEKNSNI